MFRSFALGLVLVVATSGGAAAQGYGMPQDIGGRSMEQMMSQAMQLRNSGDLEGMLQEYPADEHEALRNSVLLRFRTDLSPSEWNGMLVDVTEGGPPVMGGLGTSPFEQPVSPDATGGAYGGGSAKGTSWREGLSAWQKHQADSGRLTCDAALSLLKAFTCADQANCDLEDNYERKCVTDIDRSDTATYAQCLAVERDYVASCFSGETLEGYLVGHGVSAGRVLDKDLLCNVAAFERDGTVFAASAGHCLEQGTTLKGFLHTGPLYDRGPYEMSLSETPPFYVDGDFVLFDVSNVRFSPDSALKAAAPTLFAPTVFIALNKFSYLRHLMALKFGNSDDQGKYYLADQSPLCTVVSYDNETGAITHTCQSSRGSSGGALIQEVAGEVALVGIHVGYKDGNINVSNMAQFAPKAAFD